MMASTPTYTYTYTYLHECIYTPKQIQTNHTYTNILKRGGGRGEGEEGEGRGEEKKEKQSINPG